MKGISLSEKLQPITNSSQKFAYCFILVSTVTVENLYNEIQIYIKVEN